MPTQVQIRAEMNQKGMWAQYVTLVKQFKFQGKRHDVAKSMAYKQLTGTTTPPPQIRPPREKAVAGLSELMGDEPEEKPAKEKE
jgi:hypothetical protein